MSAPAQLFHYSFDPASRVARLALGEARIAFEETVVRPWEPGCPISEMNPSGMPPVVKAVADGRPVVLCETAAILGWIEDQAKTPLLLPVDAPGRAETRRLTAWFERRFTDEVNAVLLRERLEKPLLKLGVPDARMLREGRDALRAHLTELEGLIGQRDWLSGRRFSQADLIAAAHLSVHDYFGEVNWTNWPALKTWYMAVKSRPAFRPLLADRFPGVQPSACYAELDF